MSKLKSISGFLSSNVAILIILFSIIAFFKPNGFSWATNYTAIFLGVAMFGMGLTIKTQDKLHSHFSWCSYVRYGFNYKNSGF